MRKSFLPVLLVLWASALTAAELEDAQINCETAVRSYIAKKSPDGYWPLKQGDADRTLELGFEGLEMETVHPLGDEKYAALGTLKDAGSGKRFTAEFTVDLGDAGWDVEKVRWLGRKQASELRAAYAKAAKSPPPRPMAKPPEQAAVSPVPAERPAPPPLGMLPQVRLPSLEGELTEVSACPRSKCLTVYVAPWCPHCRKADSLIRELGPYLEDKGIVMRVIVGMDTPDKLKDYAEQLGPDTLMDPGGQMGVNSVPHFFVSRKDGGILKKASGMPSAISHLEGMADWIGPPEVVMIRAAPKPQ